MTDFILPDIGEGIVECELLEWLIAEGDTIVEDQPVAEVMTDKATVQIPAMHSGKVKKLYYKQGDIAKVHSPLFAMDVEGENASVVQDSSPGDQAAATDTTDATSPAPQQTVSGNEDFILPDIGEGIVECEIVKWLIAEGDTVAEDQVVVEVMTDKAVVEIPAKHSGQIAKLYYAQGDIAKVHTPLFAMHVEGSERTVQSEAEPTVLSQATPASTTEVTTPTKAVSTTDRGGEYEPPKVIDGRVLASPAVRRLARELSVDLNQVKGSGKKGRVMKADVAAASQSSASNASTEVSSTATASVQTVSTGGTRTEAIRGIKAAMAKQMTQSVFTIPHFTVSEEIEMDNLIAARQMLKGDFEKQGVKLSFMPFFIKAMSLALKAFPIINSQVNEDCTEITYFDDHNIGMAVDSKIGLIVPNIKGVQNLSLFDVAKEANRLIDLARDGKLGADDIKGGTISISNIGVLGGTVATPVINKPESAIVALGKMQRLPRFDENDNVKAVNIMQISWSGDHRIIDGATMVRFNNLWKSYLENPMSMLADMR
ncbi:dihydrolipoyllysine-residue acetyltransferase [Aestuariibacter sp. AA17]|uniref:Dihydrolipoamide acetyltransferase component of pyruvate dehydrogenase complex n=1 Tax=Fluctibacter corallii TaxID=2984329 RepID=A0ABT3A614_9ALTE|nr:dihydrolipoyllysine-residue acetyltransferase [Aestuariibacter sp. AA17]MCV2884130.1 dihydrolipoyllysine-residue acetyltransferase [Aestuariibacter sp. AA17]